MRRAGSVAIVGLGRVRRRRRDRHAVRVGGTIHRQAGEQVGAISGCGRGEDHVVASGREVAVGTAPSERDGDAANPRLARALHPVAVGVVPDGIADAGGAAVAEVLVGAVLIGDERGIDRGRRADRAAVVDRVGQGHGIRDAARAAGARDGDAEVAYRQVREQIVRRGTGGLAARGGEDHVIAGGAEVAIDTGPGQGDEHAGQARLEAS